jgi:hypothetical protein
LFVLILFCYWFFLNCFVVVAVFCWFFFDSFFCWCVFFFYFTIKSLLFIQNVFPNGQLKLFKCNIGIQS